MWGLVALCCRLGSHICCRLPPRAPPPRGAAGSSWTSGLWIRIDLKRIRIQHFFSLQIQIWIQIQFRIQGFDDQKFTAVQLFLPSKNCNLLIIRPPERMHKLQEKPLPLKREHPALQTMIFFYFFLYLWVIFALQDPDPEPATQINRYVSMRIWIRIHNPAGHPQQVTQIKQQSAIHIST